MEDCEPGGKGNSHRPALMDREGYVFFAPATGTGIAFLSPIP
jgi:hypothetical protein